MKRGDQDASDHQSLVERKGHSRHDKLRHAQHRERNHHHGLVARHPEEQEPQNHAHDVAKVAIG